jgi:uncharacterized protein YqhQ
MGDEDPARANHLYGGQALIEGVMMRGRDHWAVAIRRPDHGIHVESHAIDSVAKRHPALAKPGFRGVIALGQALAIGYRALKVSISRSQADDEQLSSTQMGVSMIFAIVLFVGVFIVLPAFGFGYADEHWIHSGVLTNILEGIFRVALLIGYLVLIGRMREVRRTFQYHGAEHKTIAAYEHAAPLDVEHVDQFSTLHVRCGTNFLLIIMVLTIFIFAAFGTPALPWRIGSRLIAIPIIAAIAYEFLRLGAKFPNSRLMRAIMAPGLWLQKITTKPPDPDQIEIAIASFGEVLRVEAADRTPS